jgi:hypothetical protein
MFSAEEYDKLVLKYGSFASWAIWDYKDGCDPSIISQNIDQLHSRYVLLGLNISRSLSDKPWSNFHSNDHARKLKYACNDNLLRGSYITDIFKGIVQPKSSKFNNLLTDRIIEQSVRFFHQEMRDIKITDDSLFIIFGRPGSLISRYFTRYFNRDYQNRIVYYYHYSYYRLTDKEWVEGFWKEMYINQNYDQTRARYR